MKSQKLILHVIVLLLCVITLCNCSNFPTYPPGSPCTFTIAGPASFDCYTKHGGTQKIKLLVNVVSKFYDRGNGGRITFFSEESLHVDPAITPFPVTLTVNVPNSNTSNGFLVETTIQGEECAECANGASDPNELPYGACFAAPPNTTTVPWTSRAALPRWNGTHYFPSYVSAASLNTIGRIPNVPNSCGCTVSW